MPEHSRATAGLEQAVHAADVAVREQQRQAELIHAKQRAQTNRKRYLLAVLIAVGVAIAYLQFPRLLEPYAVPDPTQDAGVAVADLHALAIFLETFRVARGHYPERLDELNLPESWASFVQEPGGPRYRRTETAFTLDWSLPLWHVVYDGTSGESRTEPPAG